MKSNLKMARINANLTMKEVGEYLGVTIRTISNYESRARKVTVDTLKKLAKLYSCTIDDLID